MPASARKQEEDRPIMDAVLAPDDQELQEAAKRERDRKGRQSLRERRLRGGV